MAPYVAAVRVLRCSLATRRTDLDLDRTGTRWTALESEVIVNDSALLQAELEASAATLVAGQQPLWPDADAVRTAVDTLAVYPPLVFAGECDLLRDRMASAARGEAFVLQGGDCAETFAAATADNIRDRIKTILQMAAVLTYGASVPVKVGRMGSSTPSRAAPEPRPATGSSCPHTAVTWSTTSPSRPSRGPPTRTGWCGRTAPRRPP